MQDAVVVAATRTAVGKAPNGTLKTVRPDEMAAAVIGEVLRRAPGIDPRPPSKVEPRCNRPLKINHPSHRLNRVKTNGMM